MSCIRGKEKQKWAKVLDNNQHLISGLQAVRRDLSNIIESAPMAQCVRGHASKPKDREFDPTAATWCGHMVVDMSKDDLK